MPVKVNLGVPLGKWTSWYFSEELKFAQGYKITVLKGYQFDRVIDVFSKYIKDIYEIKSNP